MILNSFFTSGRPGFWLFLLTTCQRPGCRPGFATSFLSQTRRDQVSDIYQLTKCEETRSYIRSL